MGNCGAPQASMSTTSSPNAAAMVIHVDGSLQEFRRPIKAGHIIAQNPDCFLCSSDSMDVDSHLPPLGEDEVLQPGQIYFLMSLGNSRTALSLHDLCALAIKASVALRKKQGEQTPEIETSSLPSGFRVRIAAAAAARQECKILSGWSQRSPCCEFAHGALRE